jgi:antitoxin ParD1/3/4
MLQGDLLMPDVQKLSIALTSAQVDALKAAVDSGEYATTSEVVREAVRDWQLKRELRREDLHRLRELWDEGKTSGSSRKADFAKVRREARRRLARTGEARAYGD